MFKAGIFFLFLLEGLLQLELERKSKNKNKLIKIIFKKYTLTLKTNKQTPFKIIILLNINFKFSYTLDPVFYG